MLFLWALVACLACLTACGGASYTNAKVQADRAFTGSMLEGEPDRDYDGILDAEDKAPERELTRAEATTGGTMDLAKAAPGAEAGGAPPKPQEGTGEAVALRGPMLIYTAQVTMAVFEVNASLGKVEGIARELGGFLAKRDDMTITIRIPVARFDEAVKRIETVGDMLHRNVAVEDVTEEFTDLEIRLRNARAIRDRLEKLLEKAATVEESVLLERELGRVAGEIDRIEGRMKFLRDRAAFSTITVTFQAQPRESINPSGARLPVSWLNDLGLGRLLNL